MNDSMPIQILPNRKFMISSISRGCSTSSTFIRSTLNNHRKLQPVSHFSFTSKIFKKQREQADIFRKRTFNAALDQGKMPTHAKRLFLEKFQTLNVSPYSFANFTNASTLKAPLSLAVLLITTTATILDKAYTELSNEEIDKKIDHILSRPVATRTAEERIELFNYVLARGQKEAEKAKKKDVIIFFGNAGAGKSTLVNFLYGCKMKKEGRYIIVDPNSKLKEITPIGIQPISCTLIPQQVSDVEANIRYLNSPDSFTFYDMPGLSDTRGVEIELANTIVMKQIVENANSVRLVMVFEQGHLSAERGAKWGESVKLLQERFNRVITPDEKSLSVIVTKTTDLQGIKEDIKSYSNSHQISDLSGCVSVYDPLNSNSRNEVLKDILSKTIEYKKLGTKISMTQSQLMDAINLGEQISNKIEEDLKKLEVNKNAVEIIRQKLTFNATVAKLGNKDLSKLHQASAASITEFASRYTNEMHKLSKNELEKKYDRYQRYLHFREHFKNLISFDKLDEHARDTRRNTDDPRWLEYESGSQVGSVAVGTGIVAGISVFFPPLWIATACGALFSGYSVKRHWWPTDRQNKEDQYFKDR